MRSILLFLFVFCGVFACYSQNDQNLFDEANSLQYAHYLRDSRQFEAAAMEYERVLFFRAGDTSIQQFLLDSYFRAARYELGLRRLRQLYPMGKPVPGTLAFTYGKLLLGNGNNLQLSIYLNHDRTIPQPDKAMLQIGNALIMRDWETAQNLYQRHQETPIIQTTYASLIQRSQSIQSKRPFVAMSLSMAVPGLGKVYTKQWKDGIIALLTVGSFAYTAWRTYNRSGFESPLFWIYGGIALGFYGGNLYGSWQSALRYNERQAQSLIHDTQATLYPRL